MVFAGVGVDLVFDGLPSIDHDVFHRGHEVTFDVNVGWYSGPLILIAKFLAVEIALKILVAQSVAFFKSAVGVLVLHLQALVG